MKIVNGLFDLPTDNAARARGDYVDLTLANKIIEFGERFCRIGTDDYSGKAGRPLKLLDWQQAVIRTGLGWRRKDKRLRFKTLSVWLPRRCGKSILASLLVTYFAMRDARTLCPIIASTREEADAVYDRCLQFVQQSKQLNKRLWARPNLKVIQDRVTNSKIAVWSSDKQGKLGKGISLLVEDEIAAWLKSSARTIHDRVKHSLKDKTDSLIVQLSTPQYDFEHLGRELWLEAKAVLDGESEDLSLMPVIYHAPDNFRNDISKALDEANPSIGITINKQDEIDEWNKCEGNPLKETSYITFSLARWQGSPERWIDYTLWQSLAKQIDETSYHGREAIIGVDFARRYDLCAAVVIIPDGSKYILLPRFYMPRDCAQMKQDKDHVPYIQWAQTKQNNLHLTPGNVVDGEYLIRQLKQDAANFRVRELRYDPYSFELIRQELERSGINCVEVGQSPKQMSPSYNKLYNLVQERAIYHPNNPVLNWNLENCRPRYDRFDKLMVEKASDIQRIDGIDATAIALSYYVSDNVDPPPGLSWATVWS